MIVGLAAWIDSPKHPHIKIGSVERDLTYKLGLDLQGGTRLIYKATIDPKAITDPTEALAGVRDVIERRVNSFGVSEPLIQTNRVSDEYRVIVELAGVHDPEKAKELIGKTPQLDFRKEANGADLNTDAVTGTLFTETGLSGKNLKRASVEFDQVTGTPQITLAFDKEGSDLFAKITKENIGKRVAIYLDQVPISAPVVQSEITNGSAVITGGFTLEEAKQLVRDLNSGALPVPIELIGQTVIGPSLGQTAIQKSLLAGAVGLAAVMIWMILYYRLPGVVASIALIIYTVLFLALIKLMPITLTLAGIAGLIMSIGMAVDANVLIFERFRENLRHKKTVEFAFKEGFSAAWNSINASNVSSLITGFVLYGFGTSIVRGFALTFAIGTIISMFTAITVSRGLLALVLTMPWTHKKWLL
jgi:preprotein translocase subunit SecD